MSQPNTITLSVDTLNDGTTVVDEVYTRYEDYPTRSIYIGEDHSVNDGRETLTFYRTEPKVSGNYRGSAKVSYKFTKDFAVDGADGVSSIVAPFIAEVKFSIPVGVASADALLVRQRLVSLTDLDSVKTPLFGQLMI
jgi:hypothetical protein